MVIPNNRLAAVGGNNGGAVNSNFTFNVTVSGPAAGDPKLAAQSGAAFAQAAKSTILNVLQEQTRPGGMFYGRV